MRNTNKMLTIYTPEDCPKWIKKKCEDITETEEGVRLTTYKPSKEIIYYIVCSFISVSTVIHLCQELEQQQLKIKK